MMRNEVILPCCSSMDYYDSLESLMLSFLLLLAFSTTTMHACDSYQRIIIIVAVVVAGSR